MSLNKMHTGLIIAAIMGLTSVSAFAATSNYDGISSKLAPVETGNLKTSGEEKTPFTKTVADDKDDKEILDNIKVDVITAEPGTLDMSSSEGKTQLNKVVTPSK